MAYTAVLNNWRVRSYVLAAALAGLTLVAAACSSPPAPPATATPLPSAVPATPQPTVVPLTGRLTRAALEAHTGWTDLRAQDYAPDAAAVSTIGKQMAGTKVIVFLGTWCSDSKREMPRFFKILDQAGIPETAVTMYGLDRSKKDAEGLTTTYDIKFVPTFIFLKDGRELGRVVEKPKGTLEGDIAGILSGNQ